MTFMLACMIIYYQGSWLEQNISLQLPMETNEYLMTKWVLYLYRTVRIHDVNVFELKLWWIVLQNNPSHRFSKLI